ncbi:hypothetical protein HK102_012088, partial [Quaeritorhiza haematococci]
NKPPSEKLTPLQAGQSIQVKFEGDAVHGGGHCQFALSYRGDSSFVVIQDVMKDCLKPGTPTERSIEVKVPEGAPNGRAVFGWTWINELGNREYYMNCADVEITGGGGSLKGPKLLVANLPGFPTIAPSEAGKDGSAEFAARPIIEVNGSGGGDSSSGSSSSNKQQNKSGGSAGFVNPNKFASTSLAAGTPAQPTSGASKGGASVPRPSSNPGAAPPQQPQQPQQPPRQPTGTPKGGASLPPARDPTYPTRDPRPSTPPQSGGASPGASCTKQGEQRCATDNNSSFMVCDTPGTWLRMQLPAGTKCVQNPDGTISLDHANAPGKVRRFVGSESVGVEATAAAGVRETATVIVRPVPSNRTGQSQPQGPGGSAATGTALPSPPAPRNTNAPSRPSAPASPNAPCPKQGEQQCATDNKTSFFVCDATGTWLRMQLPAGTKRQVDPRATATGVAPAAATRAQQPPRGSTATALPTPPPRNTNIPPRNTNTPSPPSAPASPNAPCPKQGEQQCATDNKTSFFVCDATGTWLRMQLPAGTKCVQGNDGSISLDRADVVARRRI